MQETGAWSLVWEDPTHAVGQGPRAMTTEPERSRALEPQLPSPRPRASCRVQEKPPQWEALLHS